MKFKGLFVVIPALNEEKTIGPVISKLLTIAEKVLVVDDGSRDGTSVVAVKSGAIVVKNEKPSGYDAAVSRGLNEAFKQGALAAISVDADGQHQAKDVERVANGVLTDGLDFSAGVRDNYNRPIEAVVGLISRVLFHTADPFCGLKCYSKNLYSKCGEFPADMHIGTLPLLWIKKKNLTFKFIPIHVMKRMDQPRFGTFIKANAKLAYAFTRVCLKSVAT